MSTPVTKHGKQWVTPTSNIDSPPDYEVFGNWFGFILIGLSWFLVALTFPFSMCFCLKVVKEYERVVIFRLGRLLSGGRVISHERQPLKICNNAS